MIIRITEINNLGIVDVIINFLCKYDNSQNKNELNT